MLYVPRIIGVHPGRQPGLSYGLGFYTTGFERTPRKRYGSLVGILRQPATGTDHDIYIDEKINDPSDIYAEDSGKHKVLAKY